MAAAVSVLQRALWPFLTVFVLFQSFSHISVMCNFKISHKHQTATFLSAKILQYHDVLQFPVPLRHSQ